MSKKKLVLAFKIAVSCGIFIYLIRVLDWQRFFYVFAHIRFEYIWFTPLLLIAALYSLAVRWSILLNNFEVRLQAKESFIYYLIGNFYNIILPSSIGGDVIRVSICAAKQKKPIALIASSALLERIFGLVIVLFLGTIGILFLTAELRQQLGTKLTTTALYFFLGNLFVFLVIWFLLRFLPIVFLTNKTKGNKFLSTLVNICDRIRNLPSIALSIVLFFNLLSQVFDIVASYFLAKSILLDLPLIAFFVIIPIVYISTVLPISLGGLGVREGVLALLLSRVGIAASDAVTFSFIIYLNRIFVALIGGIVQFFWHLPIEKT